MTRKVSFCVFSFNQERYIREAVSTALAQDHEPLEIIFADDCSTDNTTDVIKDEIKQYRGPHRVRHIVQEENRGTLDHLLRIAREAEGELIVVAGGDDISEKDRCSQLSGEWKRTGALVVASNYKLIDSEGSVLADNVSGNGGLLVKSWLGLPPTFPLFIGALAAYDKRIFDGIPAPQRPVLFEDVVLQLQLVHLGGVTSHVSRPLVRYREHPDAIANRVPNEDKPGSDARRRSIVSERLRARLDLIDYLLRSFLRERFIYSARREVLLEVKKTKKSYLRQLKKNSRVPSRARMYFVRRFLRRASGVLSFGRKA